MVPTTTVPMGYYVKPIDEHWAFGVGFYVPFGLMTDYGSGFAGRYYANKSEVTTLTFQPTISYDFYDKVSIGFGPTINRISGELSGMVPNPRTAHSYGRQEGDQLRCWLGSGGQCHDRCCLFLPVGGERADQRHLADQRCIQCQI